MEEVTRTDKAMSKSKPVVAVPHHALSRAGGMIRDQAMSTRARRLSVDLLYWVHLGVVATQ